MSDRKKVLIVNADDFGRSTGVNRGVAATHERGIVTSASLMVRRPAAEQAATYARHHPRLSVGLHVDLGEWMYRDGRWEALDEVAAPLEVEIPRQLARFRTLVGRDPTHLDSHQHVHRDQPVAMLLDGLAKELGVPLRGRAVGVQYCGDFYGQTGTGEALPEAISVDALMALIGRLSNGVTELGCHPGVGTEFDLPYGHERSAEVDTLCDSRVWAAITTYDVQLSSFADVY